MSFHNETHVKKTRRARWCDWCSERINKGDPSVSTSGIYEGDFYQGRYHPECSAAITRYYTVNKCWGEEMPDGPMNRGGIEEAGEPESEILPENVQVMATPLAGANVERGVGVVSKKSSLTKGLVGVAIHGLFCVQNFY